MLHDLIGLSEPHGTPGPGVDRILGLGRPFMDARKRLPALCELAVGGLARMALPDLHFPHTMRGVGSRNGSGTEPVGDNLRYTINVAQGLAWTPLAVQRNVLGGRGWRSRPAGGVALDGSTSRVHMMRVRTIRRPCGLRESGLSGSWLGNLDSNQD